MMKTRSGMAVLVGWLVVGMPAAVTPALVAAEPATLRVAVPWPERTAWHKQMRAAGKQVGEKTAGRVRVDLVGAADLPDLPELKILALPFLTTPTGALARAQAAFEPALAASMKGKGWDLLGLCDMGPVHAFSTRPVATPYDLLGGRLWSPDERADDTFRLLGFTRIVHEKPEDVGGALRDGRIDVVLVPPFAVVMARWSRALPHLLDTPLFRACGLLAAPSSEVARLSAADRALAADILAGALREAAADQVRKTDEALELLREESPDRHVNRPGGTARKAWSAWAGDVARRATEGGSVDGALLERVRRAAGDAGVKAPGEDGP